MNPWEERGRMRKVHAVRERIEARACASGLNPCEPETAKTIAERLATAAADDWAALEADAGVKKKNPLSAESRIALVNIFRQRASLPPLTTLDAPTPAPVVRKCHCGAALSDPRDDECDPCMLIAYSTDANGMQREAEDDARRNRWQRARGGRR